MATATEAWPDDNVKKRRKKSECTGTAEQVWRKGDGGLWVIARDGTDLQFEWLCFAVEEEET